MKGRWRVYWSYLLMERWNLWSFRRYSRKEARRVAYSYGHRHCLATAIGRDGPAEPVYIPGTSGKSQ